MPEEGILFVQRRAGKTGAPAALFRLLGLPVLRALRPILLTAGEGWLTRECGQIGIPCFAIPFPSSRSLWGRLLGNRLFARRVRDALEAQGCRPRLVVANDHLEGLLGLALSRQWNARRAIILRSSQTMPRDYFKYQCHRYDRVYASGDDLRARAAAWDPARDVRLLYDGVSEADFLPPKPKAPAFPRRVLVVGSESHYKGWQDFAAALDLLEQDPDFPALDLDFTGRPPDSPQNDMRLQTPRRSRLQFIGRVERFQELVRSYDLVIHPSREESFGLAMVEILAAGVPLLCSRAGVIEQIQENPALLFPPQNPQDQAEKIRHLWRHWAEVDFGLGACQCAIRCRFLIEAIADRLAAELHQLTAEA